MKAKKVEVDTKDFLRFVGAVRVVAEEAVLSVGEELYTKAVDVASVCMVEARLSIQSVLKPIEIGLNFYRLYDVAKAIRSDSISLSFGEKLVVESEHFRYTLSTIEPDLLRKPPKIPSLDFVSEVVVDDNKELLRFLSLKIGDEIAFYSNEDGFFAEMEGDVDRAVLTLSTDSFDEARSSFSRELLQPLLKFEPLKLSIGNDIPVKISSEGITYYLAPRVRT